MLEISLLGEQRVAVDGSTVAELRSPRAMALLGFLLLHRDAPQRREYIAARFWPDSAEAQARTNLRRELHALRAALPQAARCLVIDHGTLMWRPDAGCRLDVADFESAADSAWAAHAAGDQRGFRLAAATALQAYRGELMPALYDDWVSTERDRLHRKCLALLDQLIAAERDDRAYGEAIERARWRIELEPLEEAGYRTLLQLQALSGDRAAALQTYHRLVSVLERELGVAPDEATTAEYERLTTARPSRRHRRPRCLRPARCGWSAGSMSSGCCTSGGGKRCGAPQASLCSPGRPVSGRPGCLMSCARRSTGMAAR
jgi:DNA-binding SARP family transcriptional activator